MYPGVSMMKNDLQRHY